jgi:hypothetical protein
VAYVTRLRLIHRAKAPEPALLTSLTIDIYARSTGAAALYGATRASSHCESVVFTERHVVMEALNSKGRVFCTTVRYHDAQEGQKIVRGIAVHIGCHGRP